MVSASTLIRAKEVALPRMKAEIDVVTGLKPKMLNERGRYMSLETIASLRDDPDGRLPPMAA